MTPLDPYWDLVKSQYEEDDEYESRRIETEMDVMTEVHAIAPAIQALYNMEGPRTRRVINRNRGDRHIELMRDYMDDVARYPEDFFRRRFCMRKSLFRKISDRLAASDIYFTQRKYCCGVMGLSTMQKVMAAIRLLAYGGCIDRVDEVVKIGETTAKETLVKFCENIIRLYGDQYLRSPTQTDLENLLEQNKSRGFPGMIGILDCMHWEWEGCPTAWKGVFAGRSKKPTLILEAVASYDLWIWHAYFGSAGTMNDISVLNHSPLFDSFLKGTQAPVNYQVNNNNYHIPYYLTDAIYPNYAALIKSIYEPRTQKEKVFAREQESARKDIERAFGVLQRKWQILHNPTRLHRTSHLLKIVLTCIILHNMIIEDERGEDLPRWSLPDDEHTPSYNPGDLSNDELTDLIIMRHGMVRDENENARLKHDLIDHVYMHVGEDEG